MQSPYFTPPKERNEPEVSRRITRSQTRASGTGSRIPDKLDVLHRAGGDESPSTPIRRKGKGEAVPYQLPPTLDSLPRGQKRPRRSSKVKLPTPTKVIAKDETGYIGPIGKIHLAQERLMHDPWKLLVMTTLLNKTAGRAVRPIFEILIERYPTAAALSQASVPDLADLLYPLGLFNQRASSLIRFSQQYLSLGWPTSAQGDIPPTTNGNLPLNYPMPEKLDVKVFYGSGVYASDSFRIYSPLLPGSGGTRTEAKWLQKRERALERMRESGVGIPGEYNVQEVGDYMSDDEEEEGEEEWRSVRPLDKELRRYLIWRWGIEGIVYDIHTGPICRKEQDRRRLSWLLDLRIILTRHYPDLSVALQSHVCAV